jgi:hypothetical protein
VHHLAQLRNWSQLSSSKKLVKLITKKKKKKKKFQKTTKQIENLFLAFATVTATARCTIFTVDLEKFSGDIFVLEAT